MTAAAPVFAPEGGAHPTSRPATPTTSTLRTRFPHVVPEIPVQPEKGYDTELNNNVVDVAHGC
jgi:hypothetical protein